MKKLIAALCLTAVMALAVHAEDATNTTTTATPKKPKLTAEQKATIKEIIAKYDTNKDGKLSKEERAKITAEDKATLAKLRGTVHPAHKKKEKSTATTTTTDSAAKSE
ncbi:MAG TPA: EF-hand domain-containing protein [Dongiaceae bacterium]|nr:EF-hand domain-containing protein [Dongiaceae bacterium]